MELLRCSECGVHFIDMGFDRMPFDGFHCPRCGADIPETKRAVAGFDYELGKSDRDDQYRD